MGENVTIKIPDSHISFAESVAALAEENNIKEFSLEYEPDWFDHPESGWSRHVKGKASIQYTAKDGRGRPCKRLSVSFGAHIVHTIETNPES